MTSRPGLGSRFGFSRSDSGPVPIPSDSSIVGSTTSLDESNTGKDPGLNSGPEKKRVTFVCSVVLHGDPDLLFPFLT